MRSHSALDRPLNFQAPEAVQVHVLIQKDATCSYTCMCASVTIQSWEGLVTIHIVSYSSATNLQSMQGPKPPSPLLR